ncbi:hypothetical protein D3C73_1595560 [compost metagenome]
MPKGVFVLAKITNVLEISMLPTIPELLNVISAVAAFHPGREKEIMIAINEATAKRIKELDEIKESELNG